MRKNTQKFWDRFAIRNRGVMIMKRTTKQFLSILSAIAFGAIITLGPTACDPQETVEGQTATDAGVIAGTGGATATGGATIVSSGGVTGTGGSVGTGGTTAAPVTYACEVNDSKPCATAKGTGYQPCKADRSGFADCIITVPNPVSTGGTTSTGGVSGTGGTTSVAQICVPGLSIPCTCSLGAGSQMCNADGKGYSACVPIITGTGGATSVVTTIVCQINCAGAGGVTGYGGTTSTGGVTSYGGAGGYGGNFDPNASINCNGYIFTQNTVGHPVDNGTTSSRFCMNPAFLLKDYLGTSRVCPTSATLDIYNDSCMGSSASFAKDGNSLPLSAYGYCVTMSDMSSGNYHFSYKYPGLDVWAYYPDALQSTAFPASEKQWAEKNTCTGNFGLTVYVSGYTFSRATYGGNF